MSWAARLLGALALGAALAPALARGGEVVDRVVYVYETPETGGAAAPRTIFLRELAFEARIEALSAGEPLLDASGSYAPRHVRAALDRHIATDMLAHLPIEAEKRLEEQRLRHHPCDGPAWSNNDDLDHRIQQARLVLLQRVRGAEALHAAVEAEGLNEFEVERLLRREAVAARYLDVMVTPMLAPSDAELRELLRSSGNPFHGKEFPKVRCALRRWVIGQRLASALTSFLQSSRPRVRLRRIP